MNYRVGYLLLSILMAGLFIGVPTLAEDLNSIVASRGTAMLTLSDIDAFMLTIPEDKRAGFANSPVRIENMINGQLLQRQLANEARKLKLDRDPSLLKEEKLPSEARLAKVRMERFVRDLKIPNLEQLAKEKYLAHPESFVIRGKMDVQQIIITETSRTPEEAEKLAEDIVRQANEQPDYDHFNALIEKYSEAPRKNENHGLIRDATEQQSQEGLAFVEAVLALKNVGEISSVVHLGQERQILRLAELEPDLPMSYEQVHDKLLTSLKSSFISNARTNHIDKLRNLPLQADPALVESLRTRYHPSSSLVESKKATESSWSTSPSE